ncbi:hypothetical protein, conserved [Babesia ovata]|uniref:C3H1-type domain-containing protein n=1 Tax=Babesia ovata TaxID=189622 RepID=A0A2H6KJS9_9APIC|nr:uncharacterized protein BOVATA_047390 [Babesia ovata]GBE63246.1 hypothetical protein, conserved [Babesia ovata]
MHSNVTQLVKLLQASCGDEGCCNDVNSFSVEHLKKLQKTFNDIDNIEREIEGLKKEIAEKSEAPERAPSDSQSEIDEQIKKKTVELEKEISQLQPQLDKLKEEIPTKIQELNNNVSGVSQKLTDTMREIQSKIEAHKNEQKGSQNNVKNISIPSHLSNPLETAQAKLKSHEASLTSLQSLEKLMKFHESVNKMKQNKDGNCNDILKNLTEGLEKFLGFRNGNYTGEGIVYSDLDRLCDGVMSFLHGVLESVKNDDAVKTYDEDNKIKNLLSSISKFMHKGSNRFQEAITEVSAALQAWSGELEERKKTFQEALSTLKDQHITVMSATLSNLNSLTDNDSLAYVAEYLGKCINYAMDLSDAFDFAEGAYNQLDENLRDKLNVSINYVKLQVREFAAAAKNTELRDVVALAGSELKDVGGFVEFAVDARIKMLQRYLEDNITALRDKLEGVMKNQFDDLVRSVDVDLQNALSMVSVGIDSVIRNYDKNVYQEVNKINNTSQQFLDKFKATQGVLESLIEKVRKDVVNLRLLTVNENIENAYGGTAEAPLLKQIGGRTAFNKFIAYFSDLDEVIMKNVKEVNDKIGEGLYTFVSKHDLVSTVEKAKDPLLTVRRLFDEIKNLPKVETIQIDGVNLKDLIRHDLKNKFSSIKTIQKVMDAISAKTYDTVKNEAKALLSELGAIPQIVSDHCKTVVRSVMDAIESKIAEEIHIVGTAIEGLVDKVAAAINNPTGVGPPGVQEKVSSLKFLVGEFATHIDGELRHLQKSVGTARDPPSNKGTVYAEFNELKRRLTDLGKHLTKVQKNIIAFGRDIRLCINDVKHFLDEAPKVIKTLLNQLGDDIDAKIKEATRAIQENAKDQYSKKISHMFKEMKTRLHFAITSIEHTIQKDLNSGVKGLLKKMKGKIDDLQNYEKSAASTTHHAKFQSLSDKSLAYLNHIYTYLSADLPKHLPSSQYSPQLQSIHSQLQTLLSHLSEQKHFDHQVPGMLQKLKTSVESLTSAAFGNPAYPVLDAFPKSLLPFVEQLERGYVNRYEGHPDKFEWQEFVKIKPVDAANYALTPYGKNLSKVCLSILKMLNEDLTHLKDQCKNNYPSRPIYAKSGPGVLLHKMGYDVSKERNSHDGQLQNKDTMTGEKISRLLASAVKNTDSNHHLKSCLSKQERIHVLDILECIYKHVAAHYRTRHLVALKSSRLPCSVFEVLVWFSGFPFNPMFAPLNAYFKKLFDEPQNVKERIYSSKYALSAYPKGFSATNLESSFHDVTAYSHRVLTALLGHGHASGTYSCDFYTNSKSLLYPTDLNTLICLTFDMLKRLYQQLHFLYRQCCHTTALSGWRECHYGNAVGGSAWNCNTMRCPNQACDQAFNQGDTQNANQKCNQTADQTCKQHPTCGLKSPLQSFLEDGLQGFLPHSLTSKGSKMSCFSCSMSRGMPCKMPMGFLEIASMASHIKTGQYLRDVLVGFCGDSTACLSNLCSLFNCLLPSAPKTLGEMFGFYYQLLRNWTSEVDHRKQALDGAVSSSSFTFVSDLDVCSDLFTHREHFKIIPNGRSKSTLLRNRSDLYSLSKPEVSCYEANNQCGAYMASLSQNIYGTLASKNASNYLSWIVYLTETFYDLLCQLSKACHGNCGSEKSRCRVTGCAKNICSFSKQSYFEGTDMQHDGRCNSILNCRYTHPALYAYGFTFGDRTNLDGRIDDKDIPKRTCKTFIVQLQNVCSDRSVLSEIIHETIPNFLWKIREPFSLTLLALWSLTCSVHIAVSVRLDVLRILLPLQVSPVIRPQKSPRCCDSKLKQDLEKFIGKEDKVNPATEILKNLTDGLQKFLGYQETSKGYDGSGIVYSDLDRLCDGVMAFLHSVLKDVHDKQPYTVGKTTLQNNVLSHLSSKLGSGHEGFKSVIAQVATGVGGYNEEVKVSNKKAKRRIERLLEKVGEEFESMITKIPGEEIFGKLQYIGEQVSDAKLFAENYVGYGATFESRLQPLEQNINDLNSQCKNNVINARKQIKHETERLRKLSEKEWKDLKSMEMKITTVLQKLGVDVNAHISREVKTLVENLKALVQKIKDLLNDTFKKLSNYIFELEKWMKNADTMVNSAMEGTTEIADKKPGKNNQEMINAKAGQVKDWVVGLKGI